MECLICYEELKEIEIDIPCKHHFHKECLNKWLEIQKNCAYCRGEILIDEREYEPWEDSSFDKDYDTEGYNYEEEREYERNNMLKEELIEYLYDILYNIDAVIFSFDI